MQLAGRLSLNGRSLVLPRQLHLTTLRPFSDSTSTRNSPIAAMRSGVTKVVADAASSVGDAIKGAAKAVDPSQGESADMHGRVAIVTGGTAGLGFETSLAMVKAGAHVILASRNPEKGVEKSQELQKAADAVNSGGKVESITCDLSNLRTIKQFADEFKSRNLPLHVLINNASEFVPEDQITVDGFEITSGTNHFGPWYLTQLLIDNLKSSTPSRIVWTTSPSENSTPDIDWDNLEGVGKQSDLTMYGFTKMYDICSMKEFQKRLGKDSGVECFAAQPGIAKTEIFGKIDSGIHKPVASFLKAAGPIVGQTAEEGARALTYAATSPDMQGKGGDVEHIVGPFYSSIPGLPFGMANIANIGNTGEQQASNPRVYDDAQVARLYDETGRILSQKVKDFDPDRKWL